MRPWRLPASGPTVTFTLSVVLFACQFFPLTSRSSNKLVPDSRPVSFCLETASLTGLDTTCYASPRGSAINRVAFAANLEPGPSPLVRVLDFREKGSLCLHLSLRGRRRHHGAPILHPLRELHPQVGPRPTPSSS
jgi:hypothetical protein